MIHVDGRPPLVNFLRVITPLLDRVCRSRALQHLEDLLVLLVQFVSLVPLQPLAGSFQKATSFLALDALSDEFVFTLVNY